MQKISQYIYLLITIICLSACSPKFNWREIKKEEPGFTILFPEKPSSFSREIQLGNNKFTMNMLAVDIDGVNFSMAYGKINKNNNDLQQQKLTQQEVKQLMQNGMLKNINGIEIESKIKNTLVADGNLPNGQKIRMYAKFNISGDWVMQTVILGEDKKIFLENAEMFFNSLNIHSANIN